MTELSPCPFCGNPAHWCGSDEDPHECHVIECDKCGLFDMHPDQSDLSVSELRRLCADKWNRRSGE